MDPQTPTLNELSTSKKFYRIRLAASRKNFEKKIGELIRELRLKKGMTLKQAANQFGCTLGKWKKYEMGQIRNDRLFLEIVLSLDHVLTQTIRLLKIKFSSYLPFSTIAIDKNGFYTNRKRDMDRQEIESYLQKEEKIWIKEKLQALAWLAEGMKVKVVGKRLGRSQSLIQHWLWQYYKSGIGWVLKSSKVRPPQKPNQFWNSAPKIGS